MEVPRHWRLGPERKNPHIEQCDNCGHIEMVRRRPVCPECGLVFKAEKTEETRERSVAIHFVVGKKMKIYFAKEKPDKGIPVEIPMIREKQFV